MEKRIEVRVSPTVYEPTDDSWLMEDIIGELDLDGEDVLDMGTGSGILAIAAAKRGGRVVGCDINPAAVKCAEKNAKRHKVDIEFRVSDMFDNVDERYDTIIFNPPYVPTPEDEPIDMESIAWVGKKRGRAVIDRFLAEAPKYLKEGGRIILLVSSLNKILDELKASFETEILGADSLFFEEIYVVELKPL